MPASTADRAPPPAAGPGKTADSRGAPTDRQRAGRGSAAASLGVRFFLLSGSLVLGAMLLAVGLTAWRAQQVARQSVRRALADARAAQGRVERQRVTELRLMMRFLGGDPAFVAYVADGDPTSIRDLLAERQRELGFDFAAVLDRAGRSVARTDAAPAGEDLSRRPIVAEARDRGQRSGRWLEDGRHYPGVAGPPSGDAARPATGAGQAEAARPVIVAVTLGSLDQALAPFRRIESALVLVGLGSLLVAFGLSWAFSRRVASPLEQLADAADAARSGHYDRPLPAGGADEVGRLARALDGLLGELRGEREMQAYLQTLSRTLPDGAQATPVAGVLAPGSVLGGRFEILGLIGSGG